MAHPQTYKADSDVGAHTAHVSSALATLSGLRAAVMSADLLRRGLPGGAETAGQDHAQAR
jgi:hypothetical protein